MSLRAINQYAKDMTPTKKKIKKRSMDKESRIK